ncbi:hypothetical protein L1274_005787 [Duganella sp. HSC-15S17]|uniref:Uncharacterized protein n=1 Tax=Duganella violaceipulchra TaxID=2849652 RepID=A0ABT1GSQ6_9BURK|nr:hypothetical protein [Duganella violaceicalia]
MQMITLMDRIVVDSPGSLILVLNEALNCRPATKFAQAGNAAPPVAI